MVQNILLTYEHIEGYSTFAWFETVEDAEEFIKNTCILKQVLECYDCSNVTEIDL
ncbi:MAG: hypothetical protein E6356_14180 [Terrisporobacter othiniensis]|nr:hypothetical protein [Terrisporobacter othiniensis]